MLYSACKLLELFEGAEVHSADLLDKVGDFCDFLGHQLKRECGAVNKPAKYLFGGVPHSFALRELLLRNRVLSLMSRNFWWGE